MQYFRKMVEKRQENVKKWQKRAKHLKIWAKNVQKIVQKCTKFESILKIGR